MKTHEAPMPNRAAPNANPIHAAARALDALCQSRISDASVTIGSAQRPNGANPKTVAAPTTSANERESAPAAFMQERRSRALARSARSTLLGRRRFAGFGHLR